MGSNVPSWQQKGHLFLVPPGGWVAVATLLLAVVLAGGRPLWAQGIVTAGIGLLWVVWPPRKAPERLIIIVLLALVFLPLLTYLPAAWFNVPAWRTTLEKTPAIAQSWFFTPQPWFTLHTWMLWLAGTGLVAWCAMQTWDHHNRDTLARMVAGGIAGICLFALIASHTALTPGLWESTDGFGPFINRNQWGSLLGLAGIMALALCHQSVRHKHSSGAIAWCVVLAILAWGIVQNGSRGGLVILFGGGSAYWLFFGLIRHQYRYAAVAVSFFCIAFAVFVYGGGPLLERFVGLGESVTEGLQNDTRIQFYRMTQTMVAAAPWTGFGLGNFEYVLPFYLDYEPLFNRRPIHPESSFLWLGAEGGRLLLLAVAAAFAVLFWLGYKSRFSRANTIRCGAMACALMLAINAFFEVSGHRIGVLFPAILLVTLALPAADGPLLGPTFRLVARAAGVLLIFVGLLWIMTGFQRPMLPTLQGVNALVSSADSKTEAGEYGESIKLLSRAAALRPLDWGIHWALAEGWLEAGNQDEAWKEFRASGSLLPYLDWMIEKEGYLWLPINPSRAAYAWMESLRRTPPGIRRTQNYTAFLRAAEGEPALRNLLLRLHPDDPEFEFARIRVLGPQGQMRIQGLLKMTDNLSLLPDHLVEPVMSYLALNGQGADVASMASRNPRLKRLGWRVLVDHAIREGHLDEALGTYFQYGPKPALPAPLSRSDLRTIERAAALAPFDIATAISYYQALESARRRDDAFWQLRRIMDLPNAPAYIWFLGARYAYDREDYKEAWKFLRTYEEKTKP